MQIRLKTLRRLSSSALVAFSVMLLACNQSIQTVSPNQMPTNDSPKAFESSVAENVGVGWRWSSTQIEKGSLKVVHFVDKDLGWVGASGGLVFRTANGGKSWQKIEIKTAPDSFVSSLYFADASNGWLTLATHPVNATDSQGYQGQVMHTIDGGKSWQLQYRGNGLQLRKIHFLNSQEGWAAGRDLNEGAFLIHTTDRGATWTPASKNLRHVIGGDYVSDVRSLGSGKADVLTARGIVVTTKDGGSSWIEVESLRNEPLQSYASRLFSSQDGGLWILAGADSREGIWTTFNFQDDRGGLSKYSLAKVNLIDAISISPNELLACGSILIDDPADFNRRAGAILYSSNTGRDWTIAYRNHETRSINSISAIGSNRIWAVGEGGLILSLVSSSRNKDTESQE